MLDQIYSYREMCDIENVQTLQRGMNFMLNPPYSVILMSRRSNAPYKDRVLSDGITIEYEGHDVPKTSWDINPKAIDQSCETKTGRLTQNGHFIKAIERYQRTQASLVLVKVYEKIFSGVWSLKGLFHLTGYRIDFDGKRNVFIFILKLSERQGVEEKEFIDVKHTRLIPAEVKKEVWQRDRGKCVLCGANKNLHFDHDVPYSKGGASLTAKNIRLLCVKHNLSKSDKIE